MLRLLEENRLDVAFATLPIPGRGFAVTPVLDDEFMAIFPPDRGPGDGPVTPELLTGRPGEIGRASCRERVCQYVWTSVGAVSSKKKGTTESRLEDSGRYKTRQQSATVASARRLSRVK